MSAKDFYQQVVIQALIKDKWTITDHPFPLSWTKCSLFVDLGQKQLIAAENQHRKIVVQTKSFLSDRHFLDLSQLAGQYTLCDYILQRNDPGRDFYFAVSIFVFQSLSERQKSVDAVLRKKRLKLIVFNPQSQEIVQWIPDAV